MSLYSCFARNAALAVATCGLVAANPAGAQGDLLIAPTRIVLNGGGSAEVILSNIGSKPATYRITPVLRRMNAEGDLEDIDETQANATERAALAMVRYAPRRIVLAPNQPQSIRISARPAPELADGEYRIHMAFRAVPDAQPAAGTAPGTIESRPSQGLVIRLTPIYGLTMPIIVRKGQLDATATIANPRVVREGAQSFLSLDMARTGQRSVYGEIRIVARGVKDPVYLARGIAIYPELTSRRLMMQLSPQQAAALRGPMTVEYRELQEMGGKLIASVPANFS